MERENTKLDTPNVSPIFRRQIESFPAKKDLTLTNAKEFSGNMKWSDFQSRGMNAKKSGCPQTEIKIAVWASVQITCLCCGIPGYHPPDAFFSLLRFRYLGINTKESHFCNICSAFLENSRSTLAKMFLFCDFEVNQKEAIQISLCLDPAKYLAKRAISSYR